MKLSTRSRCSSNCEHTSFLELKQLKETQRDSVLPSLPHQLFNRTTNSNYFSTSLYWGFPSSQRHSNSSSLLKERSEVTARLWRLPLRISQATCTAAPVTLGKRTTASHSELEEAYWSRKQQCVFMCTDGIKRKTQPNEKTPASYLTLPVFVYLRWECGQALAKPPLRWWKSLSLNMLSLKKASSRKNTWDTWANDEAPSDLEGGSSCSRVRVTPPRVSRNKASGFSCSAWPLCERPAKIHKLWRKVKVCVKWEHSDS